MRILISVDWLPVGAVQWRMVTDDDSARAAIRALLATADFAMRDASDTTAPNDWWVDTEVELPWRDGYIDEQVIVDDVTYHLTAQREL